MQTQVDFYKSKLTYEMDPSDLFEMLEKGEDTIVIDTRQEFGYKREHIPGAINFPHRRMNEESVKKLDMSKTYVCYCDGIGCNGSTKGALKLSEYGFKVKELIGGIEWWKFDGYATEGQKSTAGVEIHCAC
ncbi:MAG: rhodanese-like domain-containing protein [Bacteroidota bacterium]